MTKQDVLSGIDKLCAEIDGAVYDLVDARVKKSDHELCIAEAKIEQLIVGAHQQLSFLREYINDNC